MSKKLPKTDNIWPKWRNFRQIWSRCAMLLLCVCDSKAFEKTPLIVHGSIYRFTRILKVEQCDQMVNCLLQCLAVYNNENLPKSKKIDEVGSNFCQISPQKCSQRGKITPNLNTLPVTDYKHFAYQTK